MNFLKGKKTYLVAIAVGAITALHSAGVIDTATYTTIIGILNGLGLATLRAGVTTEARS